ncbi:MAG: bifunctional methylenetetrahydrofolate dehydrogenase/methenyltetrahydrofolate cyclohydrolase FolD [Myxococcota bacterium]|jgi:methylenetetrahydrofolate dehydrogenase (NADP+)/methenyltetrahydrofolate cyclohydrolase|nr:bifunctional methylenetetrahydrofolate dehydrogenase/methenyltetrahydrofolate cyclohydrolase FolD [Myxococcota bacterium]
MAAVISGRRVAKLRGEALRRRIGALSRPPGLAVVRVGDDPASEVYVRRKTQRAQRLGFHQRELALEAETSQADLLALIDSLNVDPEIDGILVQLPLPGHLDSTVVLDHIDPAKDVDGFHPTNVGLLSQGRPVFVPCTPLGVMRLLEDQGVELQGARAVVIGRSNIVGRPMAMLLEKKHATVTLCHSRTRDVAGQVAAADVVIAAVGRPNFVKGTWIRPGATVIDVGINRLEDGSLCGDVEYEAAADRAGAITPVPGGVGPMTISMLMENTVLASERRQA